MKKVKFLTAIQIGKDNLKKSSTRMVTDRFAQQLVKNKQAEILEGKEDKDAEKRETK